MPGDAPEALKENAVESLREIPEIAGLDASGSMIRLAPELDVPVTRRVRQIIDAREFRRLSRISQLGLVSLVYPAARHTRFEHSLGVYRLALLFLRRLSYDPRFCKAISVADAELFLVAALLHDLGHWPFCHPIEDIRLPGVPSHELFANSFLLEGEIADVLRDDWGIAPREVVALLSDKPRSVKSRILHSMLSGPIDIDKMDYLERDSMHAGVPYGRNFDKQRLVGSLCLNQQGDGLAITEKGKTAAEMMVFARYVMFSEVYWHHAVRSATSMLQRAFYLLHHNLDLDALFRLTETEMIDRMIESAGAGPAGELLRGLFGPVRKLYKRVAQYSVFQHREVYDQLAGRPYPWLAACSERLAQLTSTAIGRIVAPHEILFDAPPVEREVEFQVDVYFTKERCYRPLGEISPVVRTLAERQFDDYVKRVRVFAHPRVADELAARDDFESLVAQAAAKME
jgi:HD superfamily phosphohydrolase